MSFCFFVSFSDPNGIAMLLGGGCQPFCLGKAPISEVSILATCFALHVLRLSWPSLKSSSPYGGL